MISSTRKAHYLADGSFVYSAVTHIDIVTSYHDPSTVAMRPASTSDPKLIDQVDYKRYQLRKAKTVLCSKETK
jgi:hypothetical protein